MWWEVGGSSPSLATQRHINSKEKEFGIGEKGYTRSLDKNKQEVDKCILVCANCHREIHEGLINIREYSSVVEQ